MKKSLFFVASLVTASLSYSEEPVQTQMGRPGKPCALRYEGSHAVAVSRGNSRETTVTAVIVASKKTKAVERAARKAAKKAAKKLAKAAKKAAKPEKSVKKLAKHLRKFKF